MAPAGQEREVALDLALDVSAGAAEKSAVGADRIETHGDGFRRSRALCRAPCRGPPQTTAELLQEECRALGRSKQQQRVDVRYVDALVEEVDGEDDVDASRREIAQRVRSLVSGCRPRPRRPRSRPPGTAPP